VLPLETFGGGEEGERVLEAMRAFEQGISSEEAKLEVTLEQGDCAVRLSCSNVCSRLCPSLSS
jgi:hypothetical protein